ncbi:MAG: hypothetical protein V4772_18805 [Pseudomonadota bacterium]
MQGKPSRVLMLVLLALAASSGVLAGPPLQHQGVMMVSATVVASCMHTSRNLPLAETQTSSDPSPSTFTISCTPGSGKMYTARIEPSSKNAGQGQLTATTASLGTTDTDTSTRVYTISAIKTASHLAQRSQTSSADGEFIKLSLNY